MAKTSIKMKPSVPGGKIRYLHIGPKWTYLKIKLSTKRLAVQALRGLSRKERRRLIETLS